MTWLNRRSLGPLALGILASGFRPAMAGGLQTPAGKPILTITGRISNTNADTAAVFDRAMLEALGSDGFTTMTPWYSAPVRFDGVRMDRLMQAVGASGDSVRAYALNDYTTEIPIPDFGLYGTLLAIRRDGNYMPVRDKGPLFIVYPFDSNPELKQQRFYSRSAWQVAKIVVK